MKILFLDHDGPMVLQTMQGALLQDPSQAFSEKTVKALNEILYLTNAEIVVSSDWRLYFSLVKLKELYRDFGSIKVPISTTPNFWSKLSDVNEIEEIRSQEIKTWLKHNNKNNEISHWVSVDDMKLNLDTANFVQTDRGILGLSDPNVKNSIIRKLNK